MDASVEQEQALQEWGVEMTRDFYTGIKTLTGNAPFPWQAPFFDRLLKGDPPALCDIPTGLGKIPVLRARGQCRIERTELDQWIDAQPCGGGGGRDAE
jgi:hypothetical protein